jgi:metal-responsive CopG/Arc/MetJ family transcriptional regulator
VAAAVKIAVSIPADLYRAVERVRKERAQSRSAVVQEALRAWLGSVTRADLVREYEDGYREHPETKGETAAAMANALDAFANEENW